MNSICKTSVLAAMLVGLLASSAAVPASADVFDGLQSYWNFDDGPADYNDKVGSLHLAEKGGADLASVEAKVTGALIGRSVHGTSDGHWLRSANVMGDLNITDAVTISYWLKMDTNSPGQLRHYSMRVSNNPDGSVGNFSNFSAYNRLDFNNTNLWYTWFQGINNGSTTQGGVQGIDYQLPVNTWAHRTITVASDGTVTDNLALLSEADYDVRSGTDTPWAVYQGLDTSAFSAEYLTMVGGQNNPGNWTDEFAIWNRVLAPAELQELHDLGRNGIPLPEPGTFALLVMGLLGLAGYSWRKR